MVKSELQNLSSQDQTFPTLAEIETADLSIWLDEKPNVGMLPGSSKASTGHWKLGSNFVLAMAFVLNLQMHTPVYLCLVRFGAYIPSGQSSRVKCLLSIAVDVHSQHIQVIGRSHREEDLVSLKGMGSRFTTT